MHERSISLPAAPAVILFATGVRVTWLWRKGIATLQPDKLDAAAHTEIVCFDKTGTLTANSVCQCSDRPPQSSHILQFMPAPELNIMFTVTFPV